MIRGVFDTAMVVLFSALFTFALPDWLKILVGAGSFGWVVGGIAPKIADRIERWRRS